MSFFWREKLFIWNEFEMIYFYNVLPLIILFGVYVNYFCELLLLKEIRFQRKPLYIERISILYKK